MLTTVFTFQSCQNEINDSNYANAEINAFKESLKFSTKSLKSISFKNDNSSGNDDDNNKLRGTPQAITATYCIKLINPTETIIEDVNNLTDLIKVKANPNILVINTTIDDSESELPNGNDSNNCTDVVQIPTEPVSEALSPAVIQAKNYLSTKGFSNSDIQNMIRQEKGVSTDLVPLVMTMISLEDADKNLVNNYDFSNMLFNTAYAQSAKDVGNCALAAIGADIIWSLGSDPGKWTKKAIKKAFGAVAKRLLGPIGAAITVVTFGLCVANAAITDA